MSKEARWLDESIRLAAQSGPPDLDWARIEQGVFASIGTQSSPRPVLTPEVPWQRLVALAAVAAASILGLHHLAASPSSSTDSSRVVAQPLLPVATVTQPAEPSGLRNGSRIHSAQSSTYQHGGWATFVVRGGSDITVDRIDDTVELSLESGAINVSVKPGQQPGSFVVLAGNTAIAVHGTRFTVLRHVDDVVVRVDEGVVSVGSPSRRGPTVRWLVGAGTQGTFSLDSGSNASFDTWVPRPPPPIASAQPPAPKARPAPSSDAAAAAPSAQEDPSRSAAHAQMLPDKLTRAAADEAMGPVLAKIQECYHQAASTMAPGVKVSVESTLTVRIAPDGHVVSGVFDPPLKPDAQACAMSAVAAAVFPQARNASELQADLQF